MTSQVASLTQAIFAGGSPRAEVAGSVAARQERVETYAQTWLTSLNETYDSLSAIARVQDRAGPLEQMVHRRAGLSARQSCATRRAQMICCPS